MHFSLASLEKEKNMYKKQNKTPFCRKYRLQICKISGAMSLYWANASLVSAQKGVIESNRQHMMSAFVSV